MFWQSEAQNTLETTPHGPYATEELPVLDPLEKRLTGVLPKDELRVVERGRQHVHWVVKALLRGDFEAMIRGWKAIKAYGQPWSQALFRIVSVNGGLFMLDRDKLFVKASCLTV
jgi:hypothetical protein